MDAKTVSKGLGWFSIALGLSELLASRRIGEALGAEGKEGVIRTFGLREVMAGAGLLQAPAHSSRMWNRVGGDIFDLAALGGVLKRDNPQRNMVLAALGFVAGVTLVDYLTARSLDRVPSTARGRVGPSQVRNFAHAAA